MKTKEYRKNKEIEIPKCIADFNDALSLYFNSINSSNISEEVIDQLIVALDKLTSRYFASSLLKSVWAEPLKILNPRIECL